MGAKAGETVAETMKSFIRWLSNKCARQPCLVVGVMVFVNPPAFVCLVMAVGLAVDYCVHIAHGFEEVRGS